MKSLIFYLATTILLPTLLPCSANAQKIEYNFGKDSEVIDSLRFVINWYKKNYHETDMKKLNLCAEIDFCDGNLNLFISRHSGNTKDGLTKLVRATNRIITIEQEGDLPIIFQTDILSTEFGKAKPAFIRMNGYYLQIGKNEKSIWRVIRMNQVF